jgi:hypothetical protein
MGSSFLVVVIAGYRPDAGAELAALPAPHPRAE